MKRNVFKKHWNLTGRIRGIGAGNADNCFTLVESLAAWTILLIAVTIFLKCLGMAHASMGKGTVMRNQYMTALERVELGGEPLRTKETKLKFIIDKTTFSMDAVMMEYGLPQSGKGETQPVTLKVIGPVSGAGE